MSSSNERTSDNSHYHLVEVEKGAKLRVFYDRSKVIPEGSTRTCSATLLRGFSFPISLLGISNENLTAFTPFESLGNFRSDEVCRTWRRYSDYSCIYIVDSVEATICRDLYVGEAQYAKAHLRYLGLLPDSQYHRLLQRLRQIRFPPTWVHQFLEGEVTL